MLHPVAVRLVQESSSDFTLQVSLILTTQLMVGSAKIEAIKIRKVLMVLNYRYKKNLQLAVLVLWLIYIKSIMFQPTISEPGHTLAIALKKYKKFSLRITHERISVWQHNSDMFSSWCKGWVIWRAVSSLCEKALKIHTHCAKKPVTTMLTYPWKCTVLHCNHLGNTWKPLVLMTRHFDYHPR